MEPLHIDGVVMLGHMAKQGAKRSVYWTWLIAWPPMVDRIVTFKLSLAMGA